MKSYITDKCSTCGQYDFSGAHTCPPCWNAARADEYGKTMILGQGSFLYANSPQEAAEIYAENAALETGQHVAIIGQNHIYYYDIERELLPNFIATECQFPKNYKAYHVTN